MRRLQVLLLAAAEILLLGGCGKTKTESSIPQNSVEIVDAASSAAPETTAPATETTVTTTSSSYTQELTTSTTVITTEARLDENGVYTTKDDVALYIYTYGKLPANFITKKEAQALGWQGGSLEPYAPGKCIGGAYFGNYEGTLPSKKGRSYTECDIDTLGKSSRGAKRIVFSNDGLIYYTGDHYKTFQLLYGEE